MKLEFITIQRGDIADGMLDGTFCQYCGVFIGEDTGYPVSCSECEEE